MIISLSSNLPRSGKDHTAAQLATLITERFGFKVQLVSFAEPLKEAMAVHYPNHFTQCLSDNKDMLALSLAASYCIPSCYKDWLQSTYPSEYHLARSARWHLQQFGTKYIREFLERPNYWLEEALEKMVDERTVYIITDTRFPNEFNFAKSIGYTFNIVPQFFPADHPVNCQFEVFKEQKDTEGLLVDADFDADIDNRWGDPMAAAQSIIEYIKMFPRT